jgi:hypothetical protein
MADFLVIIKGLIATLVLILMMQIKIGGISIESRIEQLTHSSVTTAYLQQAAEGGALIIRQGFAQAKSWVVTSTRSLGFGSESGSEKSKR